MDQHDIRMSKMGYADIRINELQIGDDVTFKTSTGRVTRKVRGFRTDERGVRTGVWVRLGGWRKWAILPHELV